MVRKSKARSNFQSKMAAFAAAKQAAHSKIVEKIRHGREEKERKAAAAKEEKERKATAAKEKIKLQKKQKFVIMSYKELRVEAKKNNISNYWKKSKEALIDELAELAD